VEAIQRVGDSCMGLVKGEIVALRRRRAVSEAVST
jgi:hypothetical protein